MNDQIAAKVESLRLLLASAGDAAARLRALDAYSGDLSSSQMQAFLCDYQPTDLSIEVRGRILRELTELDSEFLTGHRAYREMCLRAIAAEAEPALRRTAAHALCRLVMSDPGLASVAVDLVRYELDANVRQAALSALIVVQELDENIVQELADIAAEASVDVQLPLLQLLERAGTGNAVERGALSLLHPGVPEGTRRQAATALARLPLLSAEASARITQSLRRETSPVILQLLLEKLLSATETPPDIAREALAAVLTRGPAAEAALTLFAFKLGSNPALTANLLTALGAQTDATAKIKILHLLRNSGMIAVWQIALADKNPIVREWALDAIDTAVMKHGETLVGLMIEAYHQERLPFLRRRYLDALGRHSRLLPLVPADKVALLLNETDPLRRRQIAVLTLSIPLDRQRHDQRPLILGWLRLLEDRLLDPADRGRVIEKLEQLQYTPEPALDAALKTLVTQIRDFHELQELFPRLKKLVHDPAFLLPQFLDLLERFIGHYPVEPLGDILRLLRELKSRAPDLQNRMTHLARITGETWLLEGATESEQKTALFPAILGHVDNARWTEAADLLREGFQNSTLRKSEAVKIYRVTLAHPEMYEISQELFPMMKRANFINAEIIDLSLDFLARFTRKSTTGYNVTRFLQEMGPQAPGFEEKYLEFLTADRFRRFAQHNDDPARDAELLSGPIEWHDSRNWHVAYPSWTLFDQLSPEMKRRWLRREVQSPVNPDSPVQWSTTLFALRNYHHVRDFNADDFIALGRAFEQAKKHPGWGHVADRAACLFAEKWRRFEMTDEKRRALPPAVIEVATQIFYAQIEDWFRAGGLEYSGRVEPMDGVDLNQLRSMWQMGEEKWQSFWTGYTELIGTNGTAVIPPEPNQRKRTSARFHRYRSGDDLSPLMQFLFVTPAPDPTHAEFFAAWKKNLWQASKRVPEIYARSLARTDPGTKARIAALMSTPVA